ncbi:hypothetical protein G7B40_026355 [Aetokthonos hydrillicola Thurmond2011]|jgi:hypothetical protein|uniref:DUF2281 domain-containing protein n=1 Tax=Aetokthonos hydrillicola Thurmond2011 TaxID=2712845 RepID=A0AAP5M7E7_9CYAN|nr:hypothetical protein [Aetokthonos hydrillicola]MBO3460339.1 hypothetical protein [Aetokthonos hydrillicola CCALA 1050]MBW4590793.1 hypothetical protein [Aetokthonos hydrillicola CCALA 1050]MDR9898056.1 hypothetical protein [Aetokthonos hydrillicola Thurmond2011]
MNIKEQLLQEIESSSDILLAETLDFLRFLKTKPSPEKVPVDTSSKIRDGSSSSDSHSLSEGSKTESQVEEAAPTMKGSKAEDLLKFAGTWQGDDFEECLQLVYQSRSQAKF